VDFTLTFINIYYSYVYELTNRLYLLRDYKASEHVSFDGIIAPNLGVWLGHLGQFQWEVLCPCFQDVTLRMKDGLSMCSFISLFQRQVEAFNYCTVL
jgi:hypothetical protein